MKRIIMSVVPPKGNKWTKPQQEIWVEFYQQFADDLMVALLAETPDDETKPRWKDKPLETEENLHVHLQLAARLADTAMKELEYRFYNHTPQPVHKHPPKKRAAKRAYKPDTKGRY